MYCRFSNWSISNVNLKCGVPSFCPFLPSLPSVRPSFPSVPSFLPSVPSFRPSILLSVLPACLSPCLTSFLFLPVSHSLFTPLCFSPFLSPVCLHAPFFFLLRSILPPLLLGCEIWICLSIESSSSPFLSPSLLFSALRHTPSPPLLHLPKRSLYNGSIDSFSLPTSLYPCAFLQSLSLFLLLLPPP